MKQLRKGRLGSGKVQLKTVKAVDISQEQKREMFALFEQYYDHVDFDRFVIDLSEKTHVFLFREKGSDRLIGFSTIFRKTLPEIAPGLFLFSGDTVIHEDYWGSKFLQKAFFTFIVESKLLTPTRPLYWMLMSKGVKTYLMMRKNFRHSYPNSFEQTPKRFQHVIDEFYKMKFKTDYNPQTGLIVFKDKLGSVKSTLAAPSEKALKDPDAAYFFNKNPDHDSGTELACVSEIAFSDFLYHIPKFFIPGLKGKRG